MMPPPWYRGRIIIIGDAAHTTTPQLASGASIAIEDSILLTMLLQSDQPIAAVLENFMRRRYERCRMIVENSELLGEWEKNPNAPDIDVVGTIDRSYKALGAADRRSTHAPLDRCWLLDDPACGARTCAERRRFLSRQDRDADRRLQRRRRL